MFHANKEQQMATFDRLYFLTDAQREELESGWAGTFARDVFDQIDEEPFAVLYSPKASRPNEPVNVYVGALVLKEFMGLTDAQLVEAAKWDLRVQYALRATSFAKPALSLRTLARFRVRLFRHELEKGEDLLKQCVLGVARHACAEMDIDGSVRRMDSMMVESSAKVLSREELIYECVANVCRHLERERPGALPKRLARYADRNDVNDTFYHDDGANTDGRTRRILSDADALVELVGDSLEGDERGREKLSLLLRALEEQTIVDEGPAAEAAATRDETDAETPAGDAEAPAIEAGDTSEADDEADARDDNEATDDAVAGEGVHDAPTDDATRDDTQDNVGIATSDGATAATRDVIAVADEATEKDVPATEGGAGACGANKITDSGNECSPTDESDNRNNSGDNESASTTNGNDGSTLGGNDSTVSDKSEGTDTDGEEYSTKRRMRTKEDGMPAGSNMLQSPHDPDSTFRRKAGKNHRGFAANFEESCGPNGSIITNYQYGPNNTSDSEFLKRSLEDAEPVEGGALLVTDGGYDGEDNIALAAEKGIELVTTSLTGKDPADCLADFEWSEDGRSLLRCAAGHEPDSCGFYESSGQVRASFAAGTCAGCPLREQCGARCGKRVDSVTASPKSTRRARHLRRMRTEEFKAISRLRNGAETVPSTMRRKYRIDETTPAGTIMGGMSVGLKVAALNFRKLEDFRQGRGNYRENPLLGERAA